MVPGNSTFEVRKWVLGRDIGRFIRTLIFFLGFYLYLLFAVDLRLIYHGAGEIADFPSFFKGWDFFSEFVSRPGGLVEYTAAFLSQLFYIGWAGALVATLQALLICSCTGYYLKVAGFHRLRFVRFIPPILLLVVYTQYNYRFVTTMALLAALLFVCLYLKIMTGCSRLGRFLPVIFLVLSVILYYIAGGAYLVFAVLCAIYEMLFRGSWFRGLVYLLFAVIIPYVLGGLIFGVNKIDAFWDLSPFSWKVGYRKTGAKMITVAYLLYLLLPLTAFVLGLWHIFMKLIPKRKNNRKGKGEPGRKSYKLVAGAFSWYSRHNKLKWMVESLILFGIAVGAVFFSYDIEKKTLFKVDYYAYNRMWPQVLQAARRYSDSFSIVHEVNRALYHTGRLNVDMFAYPQHSGTLFLTIEGSEFEYWKKFDFYTDIGLMNMAQNDLTECLEVFGSRPMILKRLALVNMVKGDIGSARIFLGALGKTLFDDGWAENYMERLQADPNLATDGEIRHLRSLMLRNDYGFSSFGIEDILSHLLEQNRQNRMAFEYLMAWYMLNGKLDKFVQNLSRLDDFGYTRIPPLYEEAILIQLYRTRKPINLYGRQLTSESKQRFEAFSQTFERKYGRSKEAAYREMAGNYGDSYLFYYIYKFSGVKEWTGG